MLGALVIYFTTHIQSDDDDNENWLLHTHIRTIVHNTLARIDDKEKNTHKYTNHISTHVNTNTHTHMKMNSSHTTHTKNYTHTHTIHI